MSELWTNTHAPLEAYDRLKAQLDRAEGLLREIRDGKHSLPGTLVQIDRYFEQRNKPAVEGKEAGPVPSDRASREELLEALVQEFIDAATGQADRDIWEMVGEAQAVLSAAVKAQAALSSVPDGERS